MASYQVNDSATTESADELGAGSGTEREGLTGLERLVFFSDAVVAIAITLVALPLVDNARELGGGSGLDFLRHNARDLLAAETSFAVIAAFWVGHHQLFDRATRGAPRLLGVNMLWLAGIVALPVATVVQADGDRERSSLAIYVGTMGFLMVLLRLEEVLLARAGALGPERFGSRWVVENAIPVALLLVALGIGLAQPAWGTFPLILLGLAGAIRRFVVRILFGKKPAA